MSIELILPVSITLAVISWTMIFYWYINPILTAYTLEKAVEPILFLHTFRYVGLMFLLPGVTGVALDSRFAGPAAYGDLIGPVKHSSEGTSIFPGWSSRCDILDPGDNRTIIGGEPLLYFYFTLQVSP
jgi:hypothetical protein